MDWSVILNLILTNGIRILIALLIWVVGSKLTGVIVRFFGQVAERHNLDISLTKFLSALFRWGLYIIIFCVILNYLGIGTTSFVAVLGSAGLAVGLSLQGSLANFAGSVILLVMRPFSVGDYIVTADGEGTVKIIGLIYTVLVTVDNKEIYLPNGTLASSRISNLSASPTRGVAVQVGVAYSADLKRAKEIFSGLLINSAYRAEDTEVQVFVAELTDSSVKLEGRYTVKNEDYWPALRAVTEEVKLRFDAEGIEIAFPQMDVHLKGQLTQQ